MIARVLLLNASVFHMLRVLSLSIEQHGDLATAAADVNLQALVGRTRHQAPDFEVREVIFLPVKFDEDAEI